jgi:hypothetical protein
LDTNGLNFMQRILGSQSSSPLNCRPHRLRASDFRNVILSSSSSPVQAGVRQTAHNPGRFAGGV